MVTKVLKWLQSLGWCRRAAAGGNSTVKRLIAEGLRAERDGRAEEACLRYRAAVADAPDYAPAHLNLGIALEGAGEVDAAIRCYETALRLEPADAYASYNLGKAYFLLGDAGRAQPLLCAALMHKPDFPEAQVVLSSVLEAQGNTAEAIAPLQAALARRPEYAGAWRNLGFLQARLQQWHDAAISLRRAADLGDDDAETRYRLGNALVRLQAPAEAEEAYRQAVALKSDHAQAWCNLGSLLADRGQRDAAVNCMRRALAANPNLADAFVGLGNIFAGAGQLEEAAPWYRRALALDPSNVDAQVNLGGVLKDQGLWREALECYRAALALNPEAVEARWSMAMCYLPAVRGPQEGLEASRVGFTAELESLERWFSEGRIAAGWKAVGVAQPFWLAYQDADNVALLRRYGRLCVDLMAPWQAVHAPRSLAQPRSGKPLRVGVVSQFFRNHSVWNAIVRGWFQELDPERFALYAFCLGPGEDAETSFARSRARRFVQGAGGLQQWASAILGERPDVLIYPEIGMDPMSLRLASMRLASVQAAAWGHPETTGLPSIDYYVSAMALEPADAQDHYSERLLALPNLGSHVRPEEVTAAAPELGSLAIDPAIPLLICAGTPFKYAPEYDQVFTAIARRLGRCRMLFFDYRTRTLSDALRARLAGAFARDGLDADRYVSFIPWQTRERFFGLLGRASVFLDSIGFSGFNTALQAVQCGLPVVAYEGRFLRGRLASGILRRIDLAELVASDVETYVAIAARLVEDEAYRNDVRRRMAAARSALYEDREPIRALEAFLEQSS